MTSRGPVLILVGPPGSGKSTVGRLVAERLAVPFRDFDDDIERTHGVEAGELVVKLGREKFQESEGMLLESVLPAYPGVLALGGGTPTAPGVAKMLEPYHVVFLDVELDHLLKREGLVPLHPWLLPNPRAHLKQLLDERRPIYRAVSNAVVMTSGRAPDEVANEVLGTLPTATS